MSIENKLESFADDFNPSEPPSGERRAPLKTLEDGDYEFTILDAGLAETPKQKDLIFRWGLRIDAGPRHGEEFERVNFLKNQQCVNILGGDLGLLGFDVKEWKKANGRPFDKELNAAMPKLKGMRFKGKKVTTEDGFHNVHIKERLFTPAPPAPVKPTAAPNPDAEGDVPFSFAPIIPWLGVLAGLAGIMSA